MNLQYWSLTITLQCWRQLFYCIISFYIWMFFSLICCHKSVNACCIISHMISVSACDSFSFRLVSLVQTYLTIAETSVRPIHSLAQCIHTRLGWIEQELRLICCWYCKCWTAVNWWLTAVVGWLVYWSLVWWLSVVCERPEIRHGIRSDDKRSNFTVGSHVEVVCESGYRFPHTKSTVLHIVCHANGSWTDLLGSETIPSCQCECACHFSDDLFINKVYATIHWSLRLWYLHLTAASVWCITLEHVICAYSK